MNDKIKDQDATRASLLIAVADPNNHQQWETFVRRYEPMIRGWCRQWFPNSSDDMVQEIFLKLIYCMKKFRYDPNKGRFRGWLKVVTNHLMSELKKDSERLQLCDLPFDIQAPADLEGRIAAEFDLELLEKARENVRNRVADRTWMAYEATTEQDRKPVDVARSLGMTVGAVYQARYSVQNALILELRSLEDTI